MMAAVCAGMSVHGEQPMSAADAKALIEEASLKNNLEGDDIKPWHIRLNYQVTPPQWPGSKEEGHYEGTIEEWWASDTRSRTEYVVNGKRKRFDVTDNGVYESGDLDTVPYSVGAVLTDVLWPMPPTTVLAKLTFAEAQQKIQGIKMRCVAIAGFVGEKDTGSQIAHNGLRWCIAPADPYLRIVFSSKDIHDYLRNNLLSFQNRAISGEFIAAGNGRINEKAYVEKLESLPKATDTVFVLPAGAAKKGDKPVIMTGSISAPIRIFYVSPSYPRIGKINHISGTVVLRGVINEEGKMTDLKYFSGPKLLINPSIDAVKQWRYIPLSMNGKPIPVKTEVNVVYQLR